MSGLPVEAIVMAGGLGKRLAPYTTILPKPLMPLGDAPVLEYLLRKLRGHGIRRVFLAVNHLRHLIQAFFGDGHLLDLEIIYTVEDKPLGTCGPVGLVLDQMAECFLLLNGDLVTDLDVLDLLKQHARSGAVATVAAIQHISQLEFGVLDADREGRLVGVREKPQTEHLISMGVYALSRDHIRQHLRPGEPLDMPQLLQGLIDAGEFVNTYQANCKWFDIGNPADYARAQVLMASSDDTQRGDVG